jgi:hypothetical protein
VGGRRFGVILDFVINAKGLVAVSAVEEGAVELRMFSCGKDGGGRVGKGMEIPVVGCAEGAVGMGGESASVGDEVRVIPTGSFGIDGARTCPGEDLDTDAGSPE